MLGEKELNYDLRESKRASKMRLCVFYGGKLQIVVPHGFSIKKMEDFVFKKADWILGKIKIMEKSNFNPVFHKHSKLEYRKNKEEALKVIRERVEKFNKIYSFSYKKISVRNSKSRWGSCSSKKNLNFNYKILFLSEDLQNYIVVHELCHLREMNHSNKFWSLVAQSIPDYKKMTRKIKTI